MIFLCCDDLNKAQLWCKLRMRDFLKEWENISPQYYKLRTDQLLNLQTLSEIYVRLFNSLMLIIFLYENYFLAFYKIIFNSIL